MSRTYDLKEVVSDIDDLVLVQVIKLCLKLLKDDLGADKLLLGWFFDN